jgi:3-oxoacyl-[acyl-carrier protein] reductase
MSSRIILITGANGALGQAIASAFLDETPENILCLGVHTRRNRVDALIERFPSRCECYTLDVIISASWQSVVAQILERHQRIDVLVNNAGKHADHLLGTMPLKAWEEVLAANLTGAFHGCQAVLSSMISNRAGRIVNISSLSALLAPAGQTNYAAAKAGLLALTQSLAKELARLNITVNAVCPGYIETEALSSLAPEERKSAEGRVPMRRFGRPEEVAAAVRFLACPQASYITGSTLKVDGGIL